MGSTGSAGSADSVTAVDPGEMADRVGAAMLEHPAVLRLDGGPFGTVATALPGRRVTGVQVVPPTGSTPAAITVSVVLALGSPIPEVTGQLRDRVRALAGPVRVDINVGDVEVP